MSLVKVLQRNGRVDYFRRCPKCDAVIKRTSKLCKSCEHRRRTVARDEIGRFRSPERREAAKRRVG